jgi:hypothetical protein
MASRGMKLFELEGAPRKPGGTFSQSFLGGGVRTLPCHPQTIACALLQNFWRHSGHSKRVKDAGPIQFPMNPEDHSTPRRTDEAKALLERCGRENPKPSRVSLDVTAQAAMLAP